MVLRADGVFIFGTCWFGKAEINFELIWNSVLTKFELLAISFGLSN